RRAEEARSAEWRWADEMRDRVQRMRPGDPYEGDLEEDVARHRRANEGTGMSGDTARITEKLEKLGLWTRSWVDKLDLEEWTEQDREEWQAVYRGGREHPHYYAAVARAPRVHSFDY